jgi:hypothetical protein
MCRNVSKFCYQYSGILKTSFESPKGVEWSIILSSQSRFLRGMWPFDLWPLG